jgi:hypothetical protein
MPISRIINTTSGPWFVFPTFVSKSAWEIGDYGWKAVENEFGAEVVCDLALSVID